MKKRDGGGDSTDSLNYDEEQESLDDLDDRFTQTRRISTGFHVKKDSINSNSRIELIPTEQTGSGGRIAGRNTESLKTRKTFGWNVEETEEGETKPKQQNKPTDTNAETTTIGKEEEIEETKNPFTIS